MKNFSKRNGFTLVELLIVIVVIGVLSAMMMLSSNEAVSSAKAAQIISNMRNIKTAALSFRTDHLDAFVVTDASKGQIKLDPTKVADIGKGQKWYVFYRFAGNESSLKQKIKSSASSIGLKGLNDNDKNKLESKSTYNNEAYVFLRIM